MRSLGPLLRDKVRLAIFLTMLATMAASLAGWHRILELGCHFRMQYLVVSGVCLVVLLLFRDWRWGMVAAACTALNGIVVLPWYLTSKQPAVSNGVPVRVLLSNVHTANPDTRGILDLVMAEKPDVGGVAGGGRTLGAGVAAARPIVPSLESDSAIGQLWDWAVDPPTIGLGRRSVVG
jgi:hypothetical protein